MNSQVAGLIEQLDTPGDKKAAPLLTKALEDP
jgi:hypothetical protein